MITIKLSHKIKQFIPLFYFLIFSLSSFSQGSIASWDFSGKSNISNLAATIKNDGLIFANLSIGSGLKVLDWANSMTATGVDAALLTDAITKNEYFSIKITPVNGNQINITNIKFNVITQNGSRTYSLLSSKNGFTSANAISNTTIENGIINVPIANHINLTGEQEFRIYISGRPNIYEFNGISNSLVIDGSVSGGNTYIGVNGVSLDKLTETINVGSSAVLVATVTPSNASDRTVLWTSSNNSVATVDNNGKVSVLAEGTCSITATSVDQNKTATCVVTGVATNGGIANIVVNKNVRHQKMDGFGFFGPMHTWWDSSDPNYFYTDAWLEKIITDLGITIWRNEITPPVITASDSWSVNIDPYFWGQDKDWNKEKFFVSALKAKADKYAIPLKYVLTVWSPPAQYKCKYENGVKIVDHTSTKWGGNLDPDHYADFSNWLIKGIKNYTDLGIEVYAVSPQNEPYFYEPYNSCFYHPTDYVSMIKACIPAVKSAYPTIKVFGAENMLDMEGADKNWPWFYHQAIKNDVNASKNIDIFAVHGYSDGVAASSGSNLTKYWTNHKEQFSRPLNKSAWMTETSGYVNSWESTDKPGAFALGSDILNGLIYGDMSGWVYWYGSAGDLMDGTTAKIPYYVCKQFYRFIRPGAVRVDATSNDTEVAVAAFDNAEMGSQTIVLSNMSISTKDISLSGISGNFEMFVTSNSNQCVSKGVFDASYNIRIPSRSIVTLISGGTALISAVENIFINETEKNELELSIAPNPAVDVLNLTFLRTVDRIPVSIFDIRGRKVMSGTVSGENASLNIRNLAKGIYILKATDCYKSKVIRFVKE